MRPRLPAAAALLVGFTALAAVVLPDPHNRVDEAVMRFAARHAWQPAVTAADIVVGLATPVLFGAVTLVGVLLRGSRPQDRGGVRRADSLARLVLLAVSVVALKAGLDRAGPYLATPGRHPILESVENLGHVGHTTEGVFPSGHTTTAVVCAFLLLRPTTVPRRIAYVAWVGSVSGSLVLLDYHWLSDVVGAWLLGAFILTVPLPRGPRRRRREAESSPCPDSILQSQPG